MGAGPGGMACAGRLHRPNASAADRAMKCVDMEKLLVGINATSCGASTMPTRSCNEIKGLRGSHGTDCPLR